MLENESKDDYVASVIVVTHKIQQTRLYMTIYVKPAFIPSANETKLSCVLNIKKI